MVDHLVGVAGAPTLIKDEMVSFTEALSK